MRLRHATSATRDSLPAFVYCVPVDTRQHVTDRCTVYKARHRGRVGAVALGRASSVGRFGHPAAHTETAVISTREERGNAAGTTCTATQYANARRVGGWPRSLCTTDGRESLAVGPVAPLMPHDHQEKTTDRRR